MYGIVNKAIKGLITDNYGEETWEAVKKESNIEIDNFISNEAYDDSITYKLAAGAAKVVQTSVGQVLEAFGEYWILKTGMESYGSLMEAGGDNLQEFLENLPNFHSRVMLLFTNLTPPEFRISDVKDRDLHVHYYSQRVGLQDFVTGLLKGLGKMYNTQVNVSLIESREKGADHEIFHVTW